MKVDCWGRQDVVYFPAATVALLVLSRWLNFIRDAMERQMKANPLIPPDHARWHQLPRTPSGKLPKRLVLLAENFAQACVGGGKKAILWRKFLVSVKEFVTCMLTATVDSYLKYHMTWRCQTYQCINKRTNFKGSNVKRPFNFWSATRIIADKCAKKRETQRMCSLMLRGLEVPI